MGHSLSCFLFKKQLHLAVRGIQQLFFRFHVHQDIRHPIDALTHAVFHFVGDGMAGANGQVTPHNYVQIDVILKSNLAHEAFLQAEHALHCRRGFAHMAFNLVRRSRVEDLSKRSLNLTPGAIENDRRGA